MRTRTEKWLALLALVLYGALFGFPLYAQIGGGVGVQPSTDADTLDGIDSTDFARLSASNAFAGPALTWGGVTLFTTANDGAGSGLDADKLDGVEASGFAQLASSNVFLGALESQSTQPYYTLHETDAGADEQIWRMRSVGGTYEIVTLTDLYGGGSAALRFTRSGTGITSAVLASTALTWNGDTLFTTANDGSGSGLDADTLDGVDSADFLAASESTSGSFTVAWEDACTTTPSDSWKYAKVGNIVTITPTLTDSLMQCVSDSGNFSAGTDLPAALRPTQDVFFMTVVQNGGAANPGQWGCVVLQSDGTIKALRFAAADFSEGCTGPWSTSNNKAVLFSAMTYPLN